MTDNKNRNDKKQDFLESRLNLTRRSFLKSTAAGAAAATEDKGTIHLNAVAGDECEDCHGYDSAAVHNSNSAIDFTDLSGNYTATRLTGPNRWYCASCHDAHTGEDPSLTTTHTFPDSLAFPNAKNSVTGTSEPTGCSGCHGSSVNNTYWPDGAALTSVTDYPDRNGQHVAHMMEIMNRLNIDDGWTVSPSANRALATMDEDAQLQICAYCHTDDVPNFGHSSHYQSGWDGTIAQRITSEPADVASFNQFWTPYAADGASIRSAPSR